MPEVSAVWDRIADGYAKRPVGDVDSYERKLAWTRELFMPQMHVLEIGCGTGTTALHHAPYVERITATDISPRMIEIATAKAADQGITNVDFAVAGIDEVQAPDGGYDIVMAHSLLHLLKDREGAIAAIAGMLKPGGAFVSSTVCLGNVMPWLRIVLPLARLTGRVPYVSFVTPEELIQEFEGAGFVIERKWQPAPKKALFVIARKPRDM